MLTEAALSKNMRRNSLNKIQKKKKLKSKSNNNS